MQGILAGPVVVGVETAAKEEGVGVEVALSRASIDCARALIAELDKEKD